MQLQEYVTILRRRWKIIVAFLVLGIAVGFLLPQPDPQDNPTVWRATAILGVSEGAPPSDVTLLAQEPSVREAVAEEMGDINPAALQGMVDVQVVENGTVRVTGLHTDPERAVALANSLSTQLIREAAAQAAVLYDANREQLLAERSRLVDSARTLGVDPTGDPVQDAEREAAAARLRTISAELIELSSQYAETPLVATQPAVAYPTASGDSPLALPASRTSRALILGFVAIVMGAVVALVVERLDPRVLVPSELARAFRMPLLVITKGVRRGRDGLPQVAVEPESDTADAFRTLRMSLLLAKPRLPVRNAMEMVGVEPLGRHAASRQQRGEPIVLEHGRVVLFTADRAGVGVTTTVSNLAATFSSSGMSVLIIDSDQRDQTLSAEFGLADSPGLSDLLALSDIAATDLAEVARPLTHLPGARLVPAGASRSFRGADPARVSELFSMARESAQIVLIDSPPMLESVEAFELAPSVDGVVVVSRLGISRDRATQVADALSQLAIPAFGVVTALVPSGFRRSSGSSSSRPHKLHTPEDQESPSRVVPTPS